MKTEIMGNETAAGGKHTWIAGAMALALLTTVVAHGVARHSRDCSAPSVTESAIATSGSTTTEGCRCEPDRVEGDLVMLNDNGAWSWYMDERVILDPDGHDLVFSSVANALGRGGEQRDADVEVTTFALDTGRRTRVELSNLPLNGAGDDHSAAALWLRPDGRYLAMYTGHLQRGARGPQSFYRITTNPHDGSDWGPERTVDWPPNDIRAPIQDDVTYSNLLYLAAEGRLYNVARAADRTPSIMISDDWGEHWRYAGKLAVTDEEDQAGQYSNGYFKFTSNGVDRFDYVATEHHPETFDTSIYHGFVRGGRSYDGCGALVDDEIFDENAPAPSELTPVWLTEGVDEGSHHHGWTTELEQDEHGNLHTLFTTRHGTSIDRSLPGDCDHRLFYGRFDGSRWQVTEIAKMGPPLYQGQPDYTGLGAIHPNDPSTIYVSTPFDPRDGSRTSHHEIYKGVTDDGGASWTWTAITSNSTVDNLRPIVPSWDGDHTAILWLRGSYLGIQRYDMSVVGIIDRSRCEAKPRITFVDADASNTKHADGSEFAPIGAPPSVRGDDLWHERPAFGNGGRVLASNGPGDEDAPTLRTTLTGLAAGTYDVFVFHWSNPEEDWRVRAGFSASELLTFRKQASQLAEADHLEDGDDVVLVGDTVKLYRAYVGRTVVTDDGTLEVLVDDVGGGPTERTWYDGLGYARVSTTGECR